MSAYTPWGQTNALLKPVFLALVLIGAVAAVDFVRRRQAAERGRRGSGRAASEPAVTRRFGPNPTGACAVSDGVDRLAILGGWAGAVFVGGLVVSKFVVPIFDVRMALVAAPALYLLACNGLTKLWRPVAVAIAIAFILYTGVGLRNYYTQPHKEQWREATQYLIDA